MKKKQTEKLVSVIMCVHNESKEHLILSIKSICHQTYKNLEIIIINDNSDKETSEYLLRLSERDPRIRIFSNNNNLGLTKSLNIGLLRANGKYLARMDADDYSLPNRISKQVQYLNTHNQVDILGTGVISFGDRSIFMSPIRRMTSDEVQCELFFTSSLCHPSVMIRKSFLSNYKLKYNEEFTVCQDYEFWERASQFGKIEILGEVLMLYRIHSKQISSTKKISQRNAANEIILRRLKRIGLIPTSEELSCHLALKGEHINDITINSLDAWKSKLITANQSKDFINNEKFIEDLNFRAFLAKIRLNRNNLFLYLNLKYLIKYLSVRFAQLILLSYLKLKFKLLYKNI